MNASDIVGISIFAILLIVFGSWAMALVVDTVADICESIRTGIRRALLIWHTGRRELERSDPRRHHYGEELQKPR